jgi:DNA-binding transcriptional regulator GbsR (MarR family)
MSFTAQSTINPSNGRSWLREQKRFIQAAGNTSHEFGLGRLAGRIYALLLLESKSMCLDDIMAKLSISKASASITLRRLATWRLVHRVAEERGRRDFYQIEADFSKVLRGGLVPLAASKLASAGQMLEGMLGALHDQQPAEQGGVRQRLEEAKALQQRVMLVLQSGLLSRFLQ